MLQLPMEHVSQLRERYRDRHVLVTGGAGFIGGHLVDALLAVGASVCVIDDLSSSQAEHLSELIDLEPDRVRFVHASILDPEALAEASAGASVVFHLAAVGSVQRSIEDPGRSWDVNATGTLRVFEQARAAKARRVVLAASSSAYGDTEQLPKAESMLPTPRSPYAASKLAAEHLATAWSTAFEIDAVALRYFNVFGPRQPADSVYAAVIPAFAARLLQGQSPIIFGDGSQSRDFTFVANVVLATLLAGARSEPLHGRVVNIGSGERTSLLELAQRLARSAGRPDLTPECRDPRAGDVLHSLADLNRARELLGYAPFVDLEDGLNQTLASLKPLAAGGG